MAADQRSVSDCPGALLLLLRAHAATLPAALLTKDLSRSRVRLHPLVALSS